jgi:hypothetical protein
VILATAPSVEKRWECCLLDSNPPHPPHPPAGFLQVSLSKILGDPDPASTSTWLASDFR